MDLNIYFCGSIRGGREDAPLYAKIIDHLKKYGKVLTEHVGNPNVVANEKAAFPHDNERDFSKHIHDRDVEWMREADVVVAEVTQPSLGVGYEIGKAVFYKVPTLCLFRPSCGKSLSCMITGGDNGDSLIVRKYEGMEAIRIVDEYMATFKKKEMDTPKDAVLENRPDLLRKMQGKDLSIYFAGSISGGRNDTALYKTMIDHLKQRGRVLTEVVGDATVDEWKMKGENLEKLAKKIYVQDLAWLADADVMIAEVTQPSLGVGFELATAASWGKRILCLFRPSSKRTLSAMIDGAHNGQNIHVVNYEEEEWLLKLENFFSGLGK